VTMRGVPPVEGNNVDAVAGTIGHGAGDGEPFAVGREAVTAVAADGRAGVDGLRCPAAVDGDGEHVAVLIEDERAAVAGPVGRLDAYARGVDHVERTALGRFRRPGGARKSELRSRGGRRERREFKVREGRGFNCGGIVRGEADAGVEGFVEMELDGSAGLVERLAMLADEHGDDVAALFETHALRRVDVEPRCSALRRLWRGGIEER